MLSSDEVTAKIEPIRRTLTPQTLHENIRRALVDAEHVGCDITDAVTKLLERLDRLERIAA